MGIQFFPSVAQKFIFPLLSCGEGCWGIHCMGNLCFPFCSL